MALLEEWNRRKNKINNLLLYALQNSDVFYKTIVKAKAHFVLNIVSRSDIQRPKEKSYSRDNTTAIQAV